jgi:hypothetical protein
MESKHKMAIAGSGLFVAGMGLGMVGIALILPAVFEWTTGLVEKGADKIAQRAHGASKTMGTVAGTLHRSFSEAARAGVAEIRRGAAERSAG